VKLVSFLSPEAFKKRMDLPSKRETLSSKRKKRMVSSVVL
jgi:hypothetical protein